MSLARAAILLKKDWAYAQMDEELRTKSLQLLSYTSKLMTSKGFGERFREECLTPSMDIAQTVIVVALYANIHKCTMKEAVTLFIGGLRRVAGDPAEGLDDECECEAVIVDPFNEWDEDDEPHYQTASQVRQMLAKLLDKWERDCFEGANLDDTAQYDYWLGILRKTQDPTIPKVKRRPQVRNKIMSREYWERVWKQ